MSTLSKAVTDAGAVTDWATLPAGSTVTNSAGANIATLADLKATVLASGGRVAALADAATTANITLSGEQTIDGVATSGSRVLVKDQTDPAENGIYVSNSGAWTRAADMDNAAEVAGTLVYVAAGSTHVGHTFYTDSVVETLDTDDIVWSLVSSSAGLQAAVEALDLSGLESRLAQPFNPLNYGAPRILAHKLLTGTSSGLTAASDGESYTLGATTGRLYMNTSTSDIVTLAADDEIAVWFRVLSGSVATAKLTWRTSADATIGSAIDLVQVGDSYLLEATAPADTEHFLLDITNTSGSALVIDRPRLARKRSGVEPSQDITAVESARAVDPRNNIWLDSYTVDKFGGSGDDPTSDPFVVKADTLAYARSDLVFASGTTLSWLVHTDNPNLEYVAVRHQGASGSETTALDDLGGGWFGGSSTVTGTVGAATTYVRLEPDNRNSSYYTSTDATFDQIYLVEGASLPARLVPASYEKSEIVVTQEAGYIYVFTPSVKPGSKRYFRWQLVEFDDVGGVNGTGWTWRQLHEAERYGDTDFTVFPDILVTGENWLAIKEDGKSDHMGGSIHGDHKIVGSPTMLIDGAPQAIDDSTAFRCGRFEFLMRSQIFEQGESPDVLAGDLSMSFAIDAREALLRQRLECARDMTLGANYLGGMCSILRHVSNNPANRLLTDKAYLSPDYEEVDISAEVAGPITPGTSSRILVTGPEGYTYDVEILKGWDLPERESYVKYDEVNNKIYFSPTGIYSSGGYDVLDGDVLEMDTRFRLILSN